MDEATCRAAVQGRDPRFDGRFVHAVTSTGIYCRPSCPARTPAPRHSRFFPTAAAAQAAGFRACKRCRPDAGPGSPDWDVRADVVGRAMRLIADGLVEREGVPGLAAALGYSPRQLERLLVAELGAGPLALALAGRVRHARTLVERTDLPFAQVAYAAGYGSIRAFNDAVRATYAATPSELRSRAASGATRPGVRDRSRDRDGPTDPPGGQVLGPAVTLRLAFRPPLEVSNLLGHLVATAVPGVEEWRARTYRATVVLPHGWGTVAIGLPDASTFPVTVRLSDPRDLAAVVARTRRLLDLDADPVAVDAALRADAHLAPLVTAVPGRRVPRTLDPAAMALRAVLGQQVSTAAARTHAGRLVAALGTPVVDPDGGLTHLFPTPADLLADEATTVAALAMPAPRAGTVLALARALADGLDLGPGADWRRARAALAALPGVGPWTVETIALRALGDPDAFVAADLGVRKAARTLGLPATTGALDRASRAWSPWRGYAVQHLWATGPHPVNQLPEDP